jgi:hypothetical protein
MFLCPSNMFCTVQVLVYALVHVPIPVLFLFWYPHCRSSDTPSHPVPEGSTVNQYLHSHPVPTLHVIQSISYSHTPSHLPLQVIQYHTPCHSVPTLHHPVHRLRHIPVLAPSQHIPLKLVSTHSHECVHLVLNPWLQYSRY